jgi:hypothetical protein
MVRGRSVAVIGGSNLLEGIQQGEYIDSHDVVLRVNLHWPSPIFIKGEDGWNKDDIWSDSKPVDLTADIGKRTDIVFQAVSAWRPKRFAAMDVKLVVVRGDPNFQRDFLASEGTKHWLYPRFAELCRDCEEKGTTVEYFSPQYNHLYPKWSPNTGLLALKTVMYEQPSKVYVVGFDFSVFHNRVVNWINHDPHKDREYFRDHIATDPRVELHSIVQEAMGTDFVQPTFDPQIKMI